MRTDEDWSFALTAERKESTIVRGDLFGIDVARGAGDSFYLHVVERTKVSESQCIIDTSVAVEQKTHLIHI